MVLLKFTNSKAISISANACATKTKVKNENISLCDLFAVETFCKNSRLDN